MKPGNTGLRAAVWLAGLCTVCLLPGSLALPLPQEAAGVSEQQWGKAQDYLAKFYSLGSKTRDANSLEDKLKEMQKFFGLPLTGILNFRVIKIMQKPRCGVPDVAEFSLFPDSPKWTSKVVTYRIISYTRDLPRVTVDQLVAKALDLWSKEIPLSFKKVRWGTADIMVGFARGAHGDYYPFDGPGNTLAHAFAPGPGLGGDAHFDEDESWSDGNSLGINFLYVATHELGHSLGLDHSSDPNAVMFPTYGDGEPQDFRLSQDDIEAIQKIYACVLNVGKGVDHGQRLLIAAGHEAPESFSIPCPRKEKQFNYFLETLRRTTIHLSDSMSLFPNQS